MDVVTPAELAGYKRILAEARSIHHACVLAGTADGLVWGDRGPDSTFLIVWSTFQDGFQCMGEPLLKTARPDFIRWFDRCIVPFLAERDIDCFEYGTDSEALADMMNDVFADRGIQSEGQKMFRWAGPPAQRPVPEGYRVEKADRAFFDKGYAGTEPLLEKRRSAYGEDCFPAESMMYAALKDDCVAAHAEMLIQCGGRGSLSVDTAEAHRRRGLAACLSARLIEDMLSLGLVPEWDCTAGNAASERTALACGFLPERTDLISWFSLGE